ncbi:MAG: family 78 glycoside hydrolase catalytic domain [Clostridia bacterium]|nr:family 78 glycoside hydrolase catalytic domain [Clostridia bacterium]
MWICDPVFLNRTPVQTLHKQFGPKVEADKSLQNRHMLVRCAFDAAEAEKLTLRITADDYYKLYLNGSLVGVGPAQAYANRYMYNTYDLSGLIRPGRNILAVHVFYMGTLTRAWQSGDERQGLWMELTDSEGNVRAASGKSCRVFFPTAWKEKGTLGYLTQFIEDVYGAEIPEGWKDAAFDDSAWEAACENPADDHVLIPQPTPPVDVYEMKPVSIEKKGNMWFADMGSEVVGTVKAHLKAASGGTIEFRMGEELNEDGTVKCPMRCNCDYRMWWHLSGREWDETDFFDYMAFRYIEIDDPENALNPDSLSVTARNYPMRRDVGLFQSESLLANDIFRICRKGVELGAQEAFLDCPSREKGQYLGDGTITAHTHLLLTGDKDMYRKMLMDFAASCVVCPGMMAVAPGNEMQEIADYSCQFPEQVMTYYELTGDFETVRELMPVVDALEDYFDRHTNSMGLIESLTEKWNLVDWPMNLRDGYDFELSQPIGPGVHNVINAFYYGLKKDADRMRALLGLPLRNEAEAVKEKYIAAFRKEDGLFRDAIGSEHTAFHSVVLPLYYGITDAEDIPAAISLIREKGLCCGVYMAYFTLKALTRNGEYDLMQELTFSEDIHSWGNMLKEGATSCWEAWGRDQKWNTSLCHPWASAPIIMIYEDMAGIRAKKPGFEEISMEPHMPDWLGDVELNFGTVRGVIAAKRVKGEWTLTLNGENI